MDYSIEVKWWALVAKGMPAHQMGSNNVEHFVSLNWILYSCSGGRSIYKEIVCPADIDLLQYDLSKIVQWAKTWLLHAY